MNNSCIYYRKRNILLLLLVVTTTCMLSRLSSAMVTKTVASTTRRRSARLRGLQTAVAATANAPRLASLSSSSLSLSSSSSPSSDPTPPAASKKRQRRTRSTASSDTVAAAAVKKEKGTKTKKKKTKTATKSDKPKTKAKAKTTTKKTTRKKKESSSDSTATANSTNDIWCLPRTEEKSILDNNKNTIRFVMGIDEAGRGPLAGPVVAAAAIVSLDIDGITDSKKITKEQDREDLYEAITSSPNVRWAVAVMDAPFIDQVNILQATMRAMAAAASALALPSSSSSSVIELGELKIPIVPTLTIEQKGCYVITNNSSNNNNNNDNDNDNNAENYCALVDGNRCPPDMPCESHFIVKGDSKEYAIAAASILAKVSRDRLMRDYHELWPQFGLSQHKGYPTAAHMQAVKTFGASPIHRRTFAPLKHMAFDKDGNIAE